MMRAMPASPDLRTLGLGMDCVTIVDPGANAEAVFQDVQPTWEALRNFN